MHINTAADNVTLQSYVGNYVYNTVFTMKHKLCLASMSILGTRLIYVMSKCDYLVYET